MSALVDNDKHHNTFTYFNASAVDVEFRVAEVPPIQRTLLHLTSDWRLRISNFQHQMAVSSSTGVSGVRWAPLERFLSCCHGRFCIF